MICNNINKIKIEVSILISIIILLYIKVGQEKFPVLFFLFLKFNKNIEKLELLLYNFRD